MSKERAQSGQKTPILQPNSEQSVSLLQNRLLGDVVRYGDEDWTIGSIMFIGERYYGLTAQDGSVALVPAVALDNIA